MNSISNSISKVDVLFEYAHIYMDESYGYEQKRSIEILKKEIDKLENENIGCAVLIDDLNIKSKDLNIADFINNVNKNGYLNFVGMEGELSEIADIVFDKFDKSKIKDEGFRKSKKRVYFYEDDKMKIPLKEVYNDGKMKYSCAMLSFCWSLCKFGIFTFPDNSVIEIKNIVVGKSLINILHEKYIIVENQVCHLISELYGKEYTNNINYIYFE